jgi:hypothetical protein
MANVAVSPDFRHSLLSKFISLFCQYFYMRITQKIINFRKALFFLYFKSVPTFMGRSKFNLCGVSKKQDKNVNGSWRWGNRSKDPSPFVEGECGFNNLDPASS